MRSPDKRLIVGLSISAAIAVAAFAAATEHVAGAAHGQLLDGSRGGSMMGGGGMRRIRASQPSRRVQPTFRAEPRFQRFNNTKICNAKVSAGDGVKGRGKGKGTEAPTSANQRTRRRRWAIPAAARPGGRLVTVRTSGWSLAPASRSAPASPSARSAQPARPAGPAVRPAAVGRYARQRNAINIPPGNENRFVKDEVVLEFAGNFPRPGILQLLARHRLSLIESQNFTLTNSTFVRAHIDNRRAVRAVLQGLGNEVTLRTGQPNYLYRPGRARAQRSRKP